MSFVYRTYFTESLPACSDPAAQSGATLGPCKSPDGTIIKAVNGIALLPLPSCDTVRVGTPCFLLADVTVVSPAQADEVPVESIDDIPDAILPPDAKSQLKRQEWWSNWRWPILLGLAIAGAAGGRYAATHWGR